MIPCFPAKKDEARATSATRVLTVEDYIKMAGPRIKADGFFDTRSCPRRRAFGASLMSSARMNHVTPPPILSHSRGINSIQLFFDGTRWWTITIFWDSERPGQAIPEEYLPKK